MSSEMAPDDEESVRTLIDHVELTGIHYHEIAARLVADRPDADEVEFSLSVEQRQGDEGFGVRIIAEALGRNAEARVIVAAEYDLTDGYQPTDRSLQHFTNNVAVMTLVPYVREALSTTTMRVFPNPVILPVLSRGTLAVDVDE